MDILDLGVYLYFQTFLGMAGLSQRDLVLSQRAEAQLEQQKRDEELAKRLQEQLEFEEDEDARLAREAQDLEYAKMIHEKDKAKLKRAKERKKLKKQQEQQHSNESQNRTESRTSGGRRSGSHTPQRSFDATPNSNNENLDQLDADDQESVISAPHPGKSRISSEFPSKMHLRTSCSPAKKLLHEYIGQEILK